MGFSKGHPQFNSGRTHFKKGRVAWNKGLKMSDGTKNKISEANKGNHHSVETEFKKGQQVDGKNTKWRGKGVGYYALHTWIQRKLGKPSVCQDCKTGDLSGHKIHWANKDHKYKRNLKDWLRLCVLYHKRHDAQFI